jgi:hypothetical protein
MADGTGVDQFRQAGTARKVGRFVDCRCGIE